MRWYSFPFYVILAIKGCAAVESTIERSSANLTDAIQRPQIRDFADDAANPYAGEFPVGGLPFRRSGEHSSGSKRLKIGPESKNEREGGIDEHFAKRGGSDKNDRPRFYVRDRNYEFKEGNEDEISFPKILTYCQDCGLRFKSLRKFERHGKEIHPEKKLFPCPEAECKAAFKHGCTLRNHQVMAHGRPKKYAYEFLSANKKPLYTCLICDLSCPTKTTLVIHGRKQHPDEKMFACDDCGRTFASFRNMDRHVESSHERKLQYECKHCGKRYARKDVRYLHEIRCLEKKRSREREEEKKNLLVEYRCDKCDRIYLGIEAKKAFSSHLRYHDKYVNCPVCGKGFAIKSRGVGRMRDHFQMRHRRSGRGYEGTDSAKLIEPDEGGNNDDEKVALVRNERSVLALRAKTEEVRQPNAIVISKGDESEGTANSMEFKYVKTEVS